MKVKELLEDLMMMDPNAEIEIRVNNKRYPIAFTEQFGTKQEPDYTITGKVDSEGEHILHRPISD